MTGLSNQKRTLISFDWASKRLLRQKANFGILEGFLSELLNEDIRIKHLLESESNQENSDDKFNRVDLLCLNEKRELIIIEFQFYSETDYFQRMLYGTSRVISEYISKGEPFAKVRKVYSVNILYFDLGQGTDYVYHGKMDFRGIHHYDKLQLSTQQQKQFEKTDPWEIFPEYHIIKVNNFDDIAKDSLDEWIYYLKHTELPGRYQARGLKQVEQKLKYDSMGTSVRRAYDKYKEQLLVSRNMIETAILEGMEKGKSAGKIEEKTMVILNGRKMGLSIADIAVLVSMSESAVQEILKQHDQTS